MRHATLASTIALLFTTGACEATDDGDDGIADASSTTAAPADHDAVGTCEDGPGVEECGVLLSWGYRSADDLPPVIGLDDPSIIEIEGGFFVPARDEDVIIGDPVVTGARCVAGCLVELAAGDTYCAVSREGIGFVGAGLGSLEDCDSIGQ